MRDMPYALSLAALALLLSGCASTQNTMANGGTPGERFMIQAAQANLAEIETGRLATERARNSDVRQYGARMVRDHTEAGQELMRLANQMGVSLPQQPDEMHQQLAQKLSNLEGAEFDRAYMRAMVEDHQHVISMFEQQAESPEDPELQAFASKTVPILRDHLRMARMIQRSLESGPSMSHGDESEEGSPSDRWDEEPIEDY